MAKGRIHQFVAYSLFTIVVCSYVVMAVKFPLAYIAATYEDLVGEWAQVFFFAAAMIFSARLAVATSRFRMFFAFLALACFYVVMEEISWGQRLFDIATPEFFQEHNLQKEINIHNFLIGPIRTTTKSATEYALAACLVLYGLVYPLALRSSVRTALWVEAKGIPAPPIYVWPFFVLSAVFELQFFRFNEAEVAEILIPLGLSLFALHYWVSHRNRVAVHSTASWAKSLSVQLAFRMIVVFLCVLSLSFATTYACYASPRLKVRIDNRFLNGVEKFAGRYKRYEQWDTAARLYLLIHSEEPEKASVLRNLVRCYNHTGDLEKAELYTQKALAVDLGRFKKNPNGVSANLSLTRTYRMIGDEKKADYHLDTALQSALEWVRKKPTSGAAAYWLGKTYRLMDDYSSALQQFQRAHELRPTSTKYRKEFHKARRLATDERLQKDEQETATSWAKARASSAPTAEPTR